MEVIRIPHVMHDTAQGYAVRGISVGLVPTMGALHEGHMVLVRTCRDDNDITVASIFVNPTQFAPGEDFERYPRDFDGDLKKFEDAGVDVVFMPEAPSMYPENFSTEVSVRGLSDKLCGPFRPGHFAGVATVMAKLLNIVWPKRAYFGLKDYQQSLVIERLAEDLNIPTEIVTLPIVREPDGLAMSSRNQYLSAEQRPAATVLYRSLMAATEAIESGNADASEANRILRDALMSEPIITEVQYAGVYDPKTLDPLNRLARETLLAAAIKIGNVRLIDNMLAKAPR